MNPAEEAHRAGASRTPSSADPHPNSRQRLQDAAVLIPVYADAGGALRLVLVQRAKGGVHGGQIAFPGGKSEPHDASLLDTALREAHEETGLQRDAVDVLSPLPLVETITTGFRIAPFLGRIVPPAPWRPQESEIAKIIDVAVAELANPDARGEGLQEWPGWPEPRMTPHFLVGGRRLWGATYRILDPLLPRLMAGEWGV